MKSLIFSLASIVFGCGLALGAPQSFAVDLTGLNDPPAFGEMTMGPDTAKVTATVASGGCS